MLEIWRMPREILWRLLFRNPEKNPLERLLRPTIYCGQNDHPKGDSCSLRGFSPSKSWNHKWLKCFIHGTFWILESEKARIFRQLIQYVWIRKCTYRIIQHLPVGLPMKNPKGWKPLTPFRNHLAPKLEGSGICCTHIHKHIHIYIYTSTTGPWALYEATQKTCPFGTTAWRTKAGIVLLVASWFLF